MTRKIVGLMRNTSRQRRRGRDVAAQPVHVHAEVPRSIRVPEPCDPRDALGPEDLACVLHWWREATGLSSESTRPLFSASTCDFVPARATDAFVKRLASTLAPLTTVQEPLLPFVADEHVIWPDHLVEACFHPSNINCALELFRLAGPQLTWLERFSLGLCVISLCSNDEGSCSFAMNLCAHGIHALRKGSVRETVEECVNRVESGSTAASVCRIAAREVETPPLEQSTLSCMAAVLL